MEKILLKEESYLIQGAAFEVYKEMGNGFLEAVYQECLEKEFEMRGIPYAPQEIICLHYKGNKLKKTYKPDFICFGKIIIELKGVPAITREHQAQVINYLKATGYPLGVILNFGAYPKLETRRIVLS